MTKKQFMQQLTEVLREKYKETGWKIESDVFLKNNDTDKYGIMFHPPEDSITPTIYIDDFYKDFISKKSTLSEIAEQIQMLIESIKGQTSKYEKIAIDFDSCKSKIVYRLISFSKNERMLQSCPYLPFLDFAITFHVMCNYSSKGLETMRITNELLEKWQVGVRELFALAQENTPIHFPPQIEPLHNVLAKYLGQEENTVNDDENLFPILMVSNIQGINGATVILYKNLVKELVDPYKKNFYLIPSSIHEFLLMPETEETSLNDISEMVKQINEEHVRDEEILSDHAYLYNWKENKFYF